MCRYSGQWTSQEAGSWHVISRTPGRKGSSLPRGKKGGQARIFCLGQHWIAEMLKPQVFIRTAELFGPGSRRQSDQFKKIGLSWCQGWGKFETRYGDAFFHLGYEPGCENYVIMLPAKKIALVFFSTQKRGAASIAAEIARHIIGDTYSPFFWMGYH